MQRLVTIVLSATVAWIAAATASAQIVPSMTPEPYDWDQAAVMQGYFGSPDCTRDRSRASAERAIEVCTRFIRTNATRLEIAGALMVRGARYADRNETAASTADYERALALYTEEVDEAPRVARSYAIRSDAYYDLERYLEALADLDRALIIDNTFAGGYYRRAYIHFRMGNYSAAIADYDRTARLGERMADRGGMRGGSPNDGARLNPAITAARCEARAAAGVELNVARSLCRDAMRADRARFGFSRGFLRFKEGDFAGAWEDFNTAAADDEHNGYALYARGVAAVRLGRPAEGDADIARGLELEGDELEYYVNAGLRP